MYILKLLFVAFYQNAAYGCLSTVTQKEKVCDRLLYCLMNNPALVEARSLPPEGLLQSGRCVTGPLHSQLC